MKLPSLLIAISSFFAIAPRGTHARLHDTDIAHYRDLSTCDCAYLAQTSIVDTAFGTYSGSVATFDVELIYEGLRLYGTLTDTSTGNSCTGNGFIDTYSLAELRAPITITSDTGLGCGSTVDARLQFDGASTFYATLEVTSLFATFTVSTSGDCSDACVGVGVPTDNPTAAPFVVPTTLAPSSAPVVSSPTVEDTPWPTESGGNDNDNDEETPAPTDACFSGDATTVVKDKGVMKMKDLRVGDHVMTDESGDFSPIYAFGHFQPDQASTFLQLHTGNDKPIEISAEHLIFLAGQDSPVRADAVQVGDSLRGIRANGQELQVSRITTVNKEGVFAPFTQSGTLVVDGAVASSYISLKGALSTTGLSFLEIKTMNHHQIHTVLAPLRLFCMGTIITHDVHMCSTLNEDGISHAVSALTNATEWVQSQAFLWIQIPMVLAYGILLALCLGLELLFAAPLAPLAAVGCISYYCCRSYMYSRAMSGKVKAV
ncbi:Desert hedgehog protein [Seminavis robusta]|uniref:Desert hedgehog protein n=1 Tax=Seminavis robusta TaxID=568900 RepID=A0A9N8HUK8_9STRA|nr:Desert hedgehog protein [Seminavis robusta]|eukprot:Sro1670_g289950.1 Desert hedgehog protein (486) ;mRNA; f:6369-7826